MVFIDTADVVAVREWRDAGVMRGLTANVELLRTAGLTPSSPSVPELVDDRSRGPIGPSPQPSGESFMDTIGLGLIHVDFNLTNACNLACAHCHSASGTARPDELSTAGIIDVVRQVHELGALSIAFAGGEPFMRRDLVDILDEASKLPGWTVSVITNGLFLTDDLVAALISRCPEVGLNVSLEASSAETFGLLRAQPKSSPAARAALYKRVCDGVRTASEAGLNVGVNLTLTKSTADDVEATYDRAINELGAKSVVAIKFFPAGYGREHLEAFDFGFADWAAVMTRLTRAKLRGDLPHLQLSVPSAWEFYLPLAAAGIDLDAAERVWHYRAPLRERAYSRYTEIGDVAGVAELCIDGDGSVYPSILMVGEPTMLCGSTKTRSVSEIWRDAEPLVTRRRLELSAIEGGCAECSFASVCGGGSRSRAIADGGSFSSADSRCPIIGTSVMTPSGASASA